MQVTHGAFTRSQHHFGSVNGLVKPRDFPRWEKPPNNFYPARAAREILRVSHQDFWLGQRRFRPPIGSHRQLGSCRADGTHALPRKFMPVFLDRPSTSRGGAAPPPGTHQAAVPREARTRTVLLSGGAISSRSDGHGAGARLLPTCPWQQPHSPADRSPFGTGTAASPAPETAF